MRRIGTANGSFVAHGNGSGHFAGSPERPPINTTKGIKMKVLRNIPVILALAYATLDTLAREMKVLLAIPVILAVVAGAPVLAGQLDPNDPQDALTIERKIQCSTVDGAPTTFWWEGRAYSRRQGERDRLLFNVEGMNIRACVADTHPERGQGYRMVSRELLIYRDPATGEALSTWRNPWSGEVVEVLHVANDPVNSAGYEIGRSGDPHRWSGKITEGRWRWNITVPLFYPNPLASDYQAEIGGTYHATEMFNFLGDTQGLLDTDTETAGSSIGWVRMSDWLPWMKMAGREGVIYMHTAGLRLSSWDALPPSMKDEIATHYPSYGEPPPLDDNRRNVTSWIYYKRVAEGEETAPTRKTPGEGPSKSTEEH